jgi:hypothetical protein
MTPFAPFLADSLKGFFKNFLSFYVCKGVQASDLTPEGIKGIKGIKVGQARTGQKGVMTFRTFFPFIPAGCMAVVSLGGLSLINRESDKVLPAEPPERVSDARKISSHKTLPRGLWV